MNDLSRIGNDEAPGIKPRGKEQQQGQCRYCKQYRMVWAPPGTDQCELDMIAEADCNCEEGEPARMQTYNKNTAYAWARENWPGEGSMYNLMIAAIDAVTEYDAEKITIQALGGITTYSMKLDKEDRLTINTRTTQTKKARF